MLMLDKSRKDLFLKYSKIPYLEGLLVKSFTRGADTLLFCNYDQEFGFIQFCSNKLEPTDNFSNTKISCIGQIDVKEAIEFERVTEDGSMEKVFRVTAIRDSESLLNWEIIDSSQGDKYFRSVNNNKLSTFRWPFYAYATDQRSFVVNTFSKTEFMLHHELQLSEQDQNGNIQHMCFTEGGSLYLLFQSDEHEIYFRFQVKQASHKRASLHLNNFVKQQVTQVSFERINTEVEAPIQQEILRQARNKGRSVYSVQVIEQNTGTEDLITIMEQRGSQIRLITSSNE